jgi:carbohydrate-selective porin OprB
MAATGVPPDITLVRRPQSKRGFGLGSQVELTEDLGAYVRAGWNDGRTESFMFTEIDRSVAVGALLKGAGWSRPDDSLGLALYINGLSKPHRDYLAAGGQGFFLGDGRLSYATERILETYYSFSLAKKTALSLGFQRVVHPGYNRDRGPADFLSVRIHAEM